MLTGTYDFVLDKGHRLTLPSRHREELGAEVMVCRGLPPGRHLLVFSHEAYEVYRAQMFPTGAYTADERSMRRLLLGRAYPATVDKAGRIVLSAELRDYAGITGSGKVVGVDTHAEVWSDAEHSQWEEQAESPERLARMEEALEKLSAWHRERAGERRA
jgi:MraZ protein